jgi:hypothetical protein
LLLALACGCVGYRTPLDDASIVARADAPLGSPDARVSGSDLPGQEASPADSSRAEAAPTDLPGPDLPGREAARADLAVPDLPPDLTGPVLVVVKVGGGAGTVTSTPAGIDCGPTCSALFTELPKTVTLTARTDNGSDARFAGWGGACSGKQRTCTVTVSGPTLVTAGFAPIVNNLVFVSSVRTYATDRGGVAAYDGECNRLANTAGLNNAAGDAYVAWMGDSKTSVFERLGKARGFVRVDGEPVADDPRAMISDGRIYNPIDVDESGKLQRAPALTGVDSNGNATLDTDCNDWTSKTSSAKGIAGSSEAGPVIWYYWEGGTCDRLSGAVYCFMKTKVSTVTIAPQAGRRIFMSNQPVRIGQSAQARCDSDKPSGTGKVAVLRATTTVAASTLIDPSATYVRPDGVVVGLGSDLLAASLRSGIWQLGNGQYASHAVWTGSRLPDQLGTPADTCSDWTSNADGSMYAGGNSPVTGTWWQNPIPWTCSSTYTFVYCIEQP